MTPADGSINRSTARASVETPGWVSGERKLELLSRARFVVVPSRHEVQPIGALEWFAAKAVRRVRHLLPKAGEQGLNPAPTRP